VVPKNIIPGEVAANPVLIQGRFLRPGNFEMICPQASGGLCHYSRVNSMDFVPWFGPSIFGTDVGSFDAVSMIQSTFTSGSHFCIIMLAIVLVLIFVFLCVYALLYGSTDDKKWATAIMAAIASSISSGLLGFAIGKSTGR
jgi:uncharacterized membrane protein